ncbi:hypothetical protein C9J01_10475 [Photobacterium rosenbergii]|uniref:Uncharacterized protein n=1 Tax=Photobacterium rosenbergii TaxID=294936 RepID=A0A2T3NFE3_9GAMM|nr:hypothetical protein [Photobacterium rosenbergii]PSW13270.1 hypothetical protein C9J01_10475 [Photobacterium rosenbergii]
MKIAVLSLGALLQFFALYIAFYSDLYGSIYLATLISVVAMACVLVVRHLVAPVCLMAGILIGLSLSHNESDLKTLNVLEGQVLAWLEPEGQIPPQYNETETEITHLNISPIEATTLAKEETLAAVNSN